MRRTLMHFFPGTTIYLYRMVRIPMDNEELA